MKKTVSTFIALAAAALIGTAAQAKDWSTIRIGTEGAYPPFNYFDSNSQLQGFDVDIAKALCEEMKAECTFVAQDWDGIIPALLANKYDAIVASMSITDERKQQVDFTDKYYTNALNFVSMKGAPAEVTPEALAGKTLGAQSSTVSANVLEDKYKNSTIRLYPTQDEAYADLAAKRLDAVLADSGPTALWLKTDDANCCAFMGEPVVKDDEIGIAVRKEDTDLKEALNKALAAIIENGTYKKINEKYFPFSIY
ncbi:MAG: ABC transporter substrate-binding protein [Rhodobiaceae bacterium]|nr:ABC transporter substrate-binding protein [Rhodobiaceae bacterium]